MEVTRYRLECDGLQKAHDGSWVNYADYLLLLDRLAACEADKAKAEARVQALEQETARLREALREMVNMEASARYGTSEEYLLHEWPKRYKAACEKAERALEGG